MTDPHDFDQERFELTERLAYYLQPEVLDALTQDVHSMRLDDFSSFRYELPPITYEHRSFSHSPGNFVGRTTVRLSDSKIAFSDLLEVDWINPTGDSVIDIRARANVKPNDKMQPPHPQLLVMSHPLKRGVEPQLFRWRDPAINQWLTLFLKDLAVVDGLAYRWNNRPVPNNGVQRFNKETKRWELVGE